MKKKKIIRNIDKFLNKNSNIISQNNGNDDIKKLYYFIANIKCDLEKMKKKKVCELTPKQYNKVDVSFKLDVYKCNKCGRVSNIKKQICKPYRYD